MAVELMGMVSSNLMAIESKLFSARSVQDINLFLKTIPLSGK